MSSCVSNQGNYGSFINIADLLNLYNSIFSKNKDKQKKSIYNVTFVLLFTVQDFNTRVNPCVFK